MSRFVSAPCVVIKMKNQGHSYCVGISNVILSEHLNFRIFFLPSVFADSINIKILNAGAWARGSERVTVSLPLELEDYIPEVEDFYKKKHSGRKLQWYHHMSNGTVCIVCRMYFVMVKILCCKVLLAHLERCTSTSCYNQTQIFVKRSCCVCVFSAFKLFKQPTSSHKICFMPVDAMLNLYFGISYIY
jgi:hypothetical protein